MANFAYIHHQNSTIHVGKSSSPMIIFTRGNTTSKKHITAWSVILFFDSHLELLHPMGGNWIQQGVRANAALRFFDRLWAPQTVAGEMAAAFLCLSKNLKSTLEWIAKHHPWTTWKSESLYQHLQRGAKWFLKGINSHPLGFNWHPFEGPGIKTCFFSPLKISGFILGG